MKWHKAKPERFEVEKQLLKRYHKPVKLYIKNGKVALRKEIIGRKDTYLLEGEFSKKHPYKPMRFKILKPKLKDETPHYFAGDDSLCLHKQNEVGPQTTAKVYLDWAIQWIKAYERWLDSKSWPKTNKSR